MIKFLMIYNSYVFIMYLFLEHYQFARRVSTEETSLCSEGLTRKKIEKAMSPG